MVKMLKKYIGNGWNMTKGKEYEVTIKHFGIYTYYSLTNDIGNKTELFTDVFEQ